jgi:DNA-binding NarL/FixJ family response regulator
MKAIRVLIVDDQPLFRDGLRTLLSVRPEIEVVGEASNGEQALKVASRLSPDVVLMDLRMPVMDGVECTRQMRIEEPHCRIIVLTTFEDDESVFEAIRAGANGYLLKGVPGPKLAEAIHLTMQGQSMLHPSVAARVLVEFNRMQSQSARTPTNQLPRLTKREMEILRQLAKGKNNKEIAAAIHVSEGTVKNHLTTIFEKLHVEDRTQAALAAHAMGLA